jgi:hypothetical protein
VTRTAHEFLLVDALAKVFPDERPRELLPSEPLTVYAGETASFQVAWRAPSTRDLGDLPRLVLRVDAGPASGVAPAPGRSRPGAARRVRGGGRALPAHERAGPRTVRVVVSTEDGVELFAAEAGLRVHAAVLPDVDVTIAHWLHADALADRYAVAPFGERHWELLDHHLASLRAMGGNTLLTPLWTPPLDTPLPS